MFNSRTQPGSDERNVRAPEAQSRPRTQQAARGGVRRGFVGLLALGVCATFTSSCIRDRIRSDYPEFKIETAVPIQSQALDLSLSPVSREHGIEFGSPPVGQKQKTYYLPAGKGREYQKVLESFFPSDTLKVLVIERYLTNPSHKDKGLDLMMVREKETELAEIETFLAEIDANVPQVEIEARIVEIVLTDDHQMGATTTIAEEDFNGATLFESGSSRFNTRAFVESLVSGNPSGFQGSVLNLATIHDETILNVAIEALARRENTEIISTPKLTVLSGMTGVITTGQETPIQTARITNGVTTIDTTFKKTGIILEVSPVVVGDEIQVGVRPEVSVVTGFTQPSTSGGIATPVISTRNAETTVTLRDGDTLVLGGLVSRREAESQSRIPVLGSIPFVRYLFSNRRFEMERTELRFYITVRITRKGKNEPGLLEFPPDPRETRRK